MVYQFEQVLYTTLVLFLLEPSYLASMAMLWLSPKASVYLSLPRHWTALFERHNHLRPSHQENQSRPLARRLNPGTSVLARMEEAGTLFYDLSKRQFGPLPLLWNNRKTQHVNATCLTKAQFKRRNVLMPNLISIWLDQRNWGLRLIHTSTLTLQMSKNNHRLHNVLLQ